MIESIIDYDTYKLSCHLPPVGSRECFLFLHGLQSNKDIFDNLRQVLRGKFNYPQLALDFLVSLKMIATISANKPIWLLVF